ncbi:hypothetical protein Q7P37_004984 [Cladosporium fusiforme]
MRLRFADAQRWRIGDSRRMAAHREWGSPRERGARAHVFDDDAGSGFVKSWKLVASASAVAYRVCSRNASGQPSEDLTALQAGSQATAERQARKVVAAGGQVNPHMCFSTAKGTLVHAETETRQQRVVVGWRSLLLHGRQHATANHLAIAWACVLVGAHGATGEQAVRFCRYTAQRVIAWESGYSYTDIPVTVSSSGSDAGLLQTGDHMASLARSTAIQLARHGALPAAGSARLGRALWAAACDERDRREVVDGRSVGERREEKAVQVGEWRKWLRMNGRIRIQPSQPTRLPTAPAPVARGCPLASASCARLLHRRGSLDLHARTALSSPTTPVACHCKHHCRQTRLHLLTPTSPSFASPWTLRHALFVLRSRVASHRIAYHRSYAPPSQSRIPTAPIPTHILILHTCPAIMAHHRPSLALAIPYDDPFQRPSRNLPTTPNQEIEELDFTQPPPPPRQTYKVKRKSRNSLPLADPLADHMDTYNHPIPTIEMSEAADALPSPPLPSPSSRGLLAPSSLLHRAVTPPKTPAPRITVPFENVESPTHEWGLINDSREKRPIYERAGSVCSGLSDSSISSIGSGAFSAPYSASLSPDSETADPFLDDVFPKDKMVTSPAMSASPLAKRMKTHRQIQWTSAMDEHLWMTYMAYVSDPLVTPFKMLPGTTPPLGVCYRVATKAKHTWKERRATNHSLLETMFPHREGSPDTTRREGAFACRENKQPQWPRSEGATRRRLRHLCKNKPSFSAHYQRLLRTRSPSPFNALGSETETQTSEATVPPSAPPAPVTSSASSTFAGDDMKMSLITSTNPSMQPDGPLAQLANPSHLPRPQSQRTERPDNWFARIGRSQAHQKSQSLQSGLGLHSRSFSSVPLGPAFEERSRILQSSAKSWGRGDFNIAAPSLDEPFGISGDPTAPRSLKRRFRPDDDKPKRPAVQDIFAPTPNHVVRNRGFTVGTADNLASLFTPPATMAPPPARKLFTPASSDHEMSDRTDQSDIFSGTRSVPRRLAEPTPRLGSPFVEAAARRQTNTFPRSYIPSDVNPQPFQQRLQELAVGQQSAQ